MQSPAMLDLAAVVLEAAPLLIECDGALRADGLGAYTSAAAQRCEDWSRRLAWLEEAPAMHLAADTHVLIAGLLISEPLSRIWRAVVDMQQQKLGLESLASLLAAQWEAESAARDRAVGLLLGGRALPLEAALRLHRLRRAMERVSDLLVGALACRYKVAVYACRPDRAAEIADGVAGGLHWPAAISRTTLAVRTYARCLGGRLPMRPAERQVAGALLAAFSPDLLPGTSPPLTPLRMASFLCSDDQPHPPATDPPRRASELPAPRVEWRPRGKPEGNG